MATPYVSSVVIVYREGRDGREYLLLHYRGKPPRGPWTWASPAGERKPGESGYQCAKRELLEETGIDCDCVPLAPEEDGWLFRCEVPAETKVRLSEEHDRYQWLSADEAVELLEPKYITEGILEVEALCDRPGRHPVAAPTPRPEQLAKRLMKMWETGKTTDLDDIAAEDLVYDDHPNGARYLGREGARRYIQHVHNWAGQVVVTIRDVHGADDFAVAEWTMAGIQDRPIPGRVSVATNRPFELNGSTLIETRDGKIVRAADYIDVLGFVIQLGGRVELPGGVVISTEDDAEQA